MSNATSRVPTVSICNISSYTQSGGVAGEIADFYMIAGCSRFGAYAIISSRRLRLQNRARVVCILSERKIAVNIRQANSQAARQALLFVGAITGCGAAAFDRRSPDSTNIQHVTYSSIAMPLRATISITSPPQQQKQHRRILLLKSIPVSFLYSLLDDS